MSVFLENKEIQKNPDSESSPKSPAKTKKPDRIFIGTDRKIGEGSFKMVYSCKITDIGNSLFVLPEGTDENKLCIAIVDINQLIRKRNRKNKIFITLFNEYIEQGPREQRVNPNKDDFEFKIKNEVHHIEEEIKLQKELFQKQLAPQIYDHANDYTNIYYIYLPVIMMKQ